MSWTGCDQGKGWDKDVRTWGSIVAGTRPAAGGDIRTLRELCSEPCVSTDALCKYL